MDYPTCEEIIAEAQRTYLAEWVDVPDIDLLCERYGDQNGLKIYSSEEELEAKLIAAHRNCSAAHRGAAGRRI